MLSAAALTSWREMRSWAADWPGRCEDPPREGHSQQGASVRLPSRSASAHPLNQPWQHWSVRSASATVSAKATTPRRIRTRVDSRRSTLAEQDIEAAPGGYDSDHRELNIVQNADPPGGADSGGSLAGSRSTVVPPMRHSDLLRERLSWSIAIAQGAKGGSCHGSTKGRANQATTDLRAHHR